MADAASARITCRSRAHAHAQVPCGTRVHEYCTYCTLMTLIGNQACGSMHYVLNRGSILPRGNLESGRQALYALPKAHALQNSLMMKKHARHADPGLRYLILCIQKYNIGIIGMMETERYAHQGCYIFINLAV